MMKYVLILCIIVSLVIAVSTIAQTQDTSDTSQEKIDVKSPTAQPTVTPGPDASKTPRVYPIAPGVWYPGQPLPEKPFRYYRVRCWPGCHHTSPYGKYPDQPKAEESTSQATPTPQTEVE